MAMNSADQYHFDSLHGPLPIPMIEKFVYGIHKISVEYGTDVNKTGDLDDKVANDSNFKSLIGRPEITLFRESTKGLVICIYIYIHISLVIMLYIL